MLTNKRLKQPVNLRYSSLADLVYSHLIVEIMSGLWKPGSVLSVASQAERFNISLTPVREAALRLVTEGALTLEARSFVVPTLTSETFAELLKLRIILEDLLTREAVENAPPGLADELESLHKALIKAKMRKQFETVMTVNRTFHFRLYEEAKMPQTLAIVRLLWARTGPYQFSLYLNQELPDPEKHEHKRVLAAIRSGDPVRAGKAIVDDITVNVGRIREAVAKNLDVDK